MSLIVSCYFESQFLIVGEELFLAPFGADVVWAFAF